MWQDYLVDGKKYGNLYHLNTSMDWERNTKKGIQECFQIANTGEKKTPGIGEGAFRPLSRINWMLDSISYIRLVAD